MVSDQISLFIGPYQHRKQTECKDQEEEEMQKVDRDGKFGCHRNKQGERLERRVKVSTRNSQYAQTTVALRLIPIAQCTSTRFPPCSSLSITAHSSPKLSSMFSSRSSRFDTWTWLIPRERNWSKDSFERSRSMTVRTKLISWGLCAGRFSAA